MQDTKKEKIYKTIMLIIITTSITFMVTSICMYNYFVKVDIQKDTDNIARRFEKTKSMLEEYYIGDLDTKNMEEFAIKGYVEGVGEEYTEYLTKTEYEDIMTAVTGDYVGIGIYMYQNSDGNTVVLMPLPNSPAEQAGIKANDIIVSVNGEKCTDMDFEVIASKIKGKEKTTVELELLRENETINKTIERKTIEIEDSKSEVLEGNIGYIQLSTFDMGASDNVQKFLSEFENKGINKVIIDLRNNTGGVVSEAIDFSEFFLEKGSVIMRSYNKKDKETVITSTGKNKKEFETVILVNEYSASATEIVAAALKDNNVAKIVGTKTFGKGVMQEIVPLFEGALKVTIEELRSPKGETFNKIGITPDVVIENNLDTKEDEQLNKAIELLK